MPPPPLSPLAHIFPGVQFHEGKGSSCPSPLVPSCSHISRGAVTWGQRELFCPFRSRPTSSHIYIIYYICTLYIYTSLCIQPADSRSLFEAHIVAIYIFRYINHDFKYNSLTTCLCLNPLPKSGVQLCWILCGIQIWTSEYQAYIRENPGACCGHPLHGCL